MKRFWVILAIILVPFYYGSAQPTANDGDGLEAIKIAFISKQMNLTPEEAQKFWPVYNQYIADFKKMRKENTGDELEWREKSLNLIKKYKPEFLKCVSQDKFNKLLKSEGDWRQIVKDEINRRRQQRQLLKRRPGL